MKRVGKPARGKRPKSKVKGLTIGLTGFAKISAIEGLRLTPDMRTTFRTLKRTGASPQQRRAAILRKYGTAS
jgi:hypothetical protein